MAYLTGYLTELTDQTLRCRLLDRFLLSHLRLRFGQWAQPARSLCRRERC